MQEALEDHQRMTGAPSAKAGSFRDRPTQRDADATKKASARKDISEMTTEDKAALSPLQREYMRLCTGAVQPDPSVLDAIE